MKIMIVVAKSTGPKPVVYKIDRAFTDLVRHPIENAARNISDDIQSMDGIERAQAVYGALESLDPQTHLLLSSTFAANKSYDKMLRWMASSFKL